MTWFTVLALYVRPWVHVGSWVCQDLSTVETGSSYTCLSLKYYLPTLWIICYTRFVTWNTNYGHYFKGSTLFASVGVTTIQRWRWVQEWILLWLTVQFPVTRYVTLFTPGRWIGIRLTERNSKNTCNSLGLFVLQYQILWSCVHPHILHY